MRPAPLARYLATVLRGTLGPPASRARVPCIAWMAALPLLAACVDSPVAPHATGPIPQAPPAFMLLTLDAEWTGALSTDWSTAGNWNPAALPDSASGVDIPAASLLTTMPQLGADAQITDLRVGLASTLDLGGYTLTSWGSVDAVGSVANGVLRMGGTGALLAGSVNRLAVDGRVSLERPVVATGAVSVSGSLSVADSSLSIQIP
jgi:hypothetical protein